MSDADWRRGDANSKGAAICGSKIRLDRVVPDFYPAVLFQENDNAMLIKHADDRTRDFETLKALAARPDASADTRKKIDQNNALRINHVPPLLASQARSVSAQKNSQVSAPIHQGRLLKAPITANKSNAIATGTAAPDGIHTPKPCNKPETMPGSPSSGDTGCSHSHSAAGSALSSHTSSQRCNARWNHMTRISSAFMVT